MQEVKPEFLAEHLPTAGTRRRGTSDLTMSGVYQQIPLELFQRLQRRYPRLRKLRRRG